MSRRPDSSHWKSALLVHSSAATTAAAPCSPVQCLVPISRSPLEMLSTVTQSSPIQTRTLRKHVQTTSSLASRSSKAWVPSIEISGSLPPPSEHASSLAVIQVHSRRIPDGLPRPLPPLPLILGLQSQKSNALQVDANSPAHSGSTAAATMYMNKLTERITYLSHPIGTVWQPNTVHSHVGIRHINWISAPLKYMLNPLVSWEYPDGPSGSPVDPENPGYKIKTISIVFLKTLFIWHRMGTYPYSLVSVCLMQLNRVGADGSHFVERSNSVVQSGAIGDNWLWSMWIVSAIQFRTFGVIVLPFRSCHTICDRCSNISNSAPVASRMIPVIISVIIW